MRPFYAPAFNGDSNLAFAAIAEMIDACHAATPAEYELVGRLLGYAAAALHSLKLSMKPDLTDARILQYRRTAIALGRSAEQCRKALEAMQTKRDKQRAQVAAASAMPAPRPAPVAPPPPSAPPRQMPPRQPHPPARAASTQAPTPSQPVAEPQAPVQSQPAEPQTPAQSQPAAEPQAPVQSQPPASADRSAAGSPSAYPNSEVEGDPEFTTDIEVMKHNARAMLADLQALAAEFAPKPPEASIASKALSGNQHAGRNLHGM
jgi:outer membrane biosynthesis protein TonB